jgi:hypothetical protein
MHSCVYTDFKAYLRLAHQPFTENVEEMPGPVAGTWFGPNTFPPLESAFQDFKGQGSNANVS